MIEPKIIMKTDLSRIPLRLDRYGMKTFDYGLIISPKIGMLILATLEPSNSRVNEE